MVGDPKASFHFVLLLSLTVPDAIASANIILLKILWIIMNLIRVPFIDKNHRRSLRTDPLYLVLPVRLPGAISIQA